MSHYAVLVLHRGNQSIDELLAPYSENIKVTPYKEQTRQEALEYIKEKLVPHNEFMTKYTDDELIDWYVSQYGSYSIGDDGDIYTTYNPDSKWDWYQIGGRFSGDLTLNDEGLAECEREYKNNWGYEIEPDMRDEYRYTNSAPVKYIQWSIPLSDERKNELKRWWEINVERDEPKDGEERDEFFFWKPEYYKERYRDAETYIETQEITCYHAVITPDGVWHEPSKMGWWACTDGEPTAELEWDLNFMDRFIDGADPEWIATIVDCHI